MTSQNAINNIVPENSFTVQRTVAGAGTPVVNLCRHFDTTNTASNARIEARTEVGGGDPFLTAVVTGVKDWNLGQAHTDNSLRITTGGGPTAGSVVWKMTTNNERTMPFQPAFRATANAQNNVTGAGATYTVLFANEEYDQGNNYASPTFTAPVVGIYRFDYQLVCTGITAAANAGTVNFLINGVTQRVIQLFQAFNVSYSPGVLGVSGGMDIQLGVGDTVVVQLTIDSMAGNTVSINAGPTASWFTGHLIC